MHGLHPSSVLNLALTSKHMYGLLLGRLGEENTFDRNQHRALGGVELCVDRRWWRAALLAIRRGYGDVVSSTITMYGAQRWTCYSYLAVATMAGEEEVVDALLEVEGVEPSMRDLACAIVYGRPRIVEKMLQRMDLDLVVWEEGEEEMYWEGVVSGVCHRGHADVVTVLVEHGVLDRLDPEATADGFQAACGKGWVEIVRLFLTLPSVDPGMDDGAALVDAALNGHIEVVELLLGDPRVDPACASNMPIRYASHGGHADIVRLLLGHPSVDPSAQDNEALLAAVESGRLRVVELLLKDPRVDRHARGGEAFSRCNLQLEDGDVFQTIAHLLERSDPE